MFNKRQIFEGLWLFSGYILEQKHATQGPHVCDYAAKVQERSEAEKSMALYLELLDRSSQTLETNKFAHSSKRHLFTAVVAKSDYSQGRPS